LKARASVDARLLAWINGWFREPERPQYFEVEAYQNWLEKAGADLYEQFYSKYASFAGKRILDIGCGYGGKIAAYCAQGPELVCGLDIDNSVLIQAKHRAATIAIETGFIGADAAALPYPDDTFDLIISDDGFDHFKQPDQVLNEIVRVLRPDGLALVSFVPYYSTHCSHMNEYLRVPWHHVLFRRPAIRQALHLVEEKQKSADSLGRADGLFENFSNNLSRLTLRGFKGLLRGRQGVRLIRLRQQSKDWARLLTYLPGLREFVTDAVYCVLAKQQSAHVLPSDLRRQTALNASTDLQAIRRRCGSLFDGRTSRKEIGSQKFSR
jgi:ubiquinone/menaquinone biosynthesis C-methylase UbiE